MIIAVQIVQVAFQATVCPSLKQRKRVETSKFYTNLKKFGICIQYFKPVSRSVYSIYIIYPKLSFSVFSSKIYVYYFNPLSFRVCCIYMHSISCIFQRSLAVTSLNLLHYTINILHCYIVHCPQFFAFICLLYYCPFLTVKPTSRMIYPLIHTLQLNFFFYHFYR